MSKYQALIDALEAGPTEGKWHIEGNEGTPPHRWSVWAACGRFICHFIELIDSAKAQQEADIRYIAEANPATIRALLADLERAEKALAALAQQAQEPVAWKPIDADTVPDKSQRIFWMLVDCAPVLGSYVEIPFREMRDADGRYIDQQDADEYWATYADGEHVKPTHYCELKPPSTTPPAPQPAPVDERHRAVALELDRLMLVIESAVRWQDPTHHAAVLSLLKANRAALQSPAPQTKGGEA